MDKRRQLIETREDLLKAADNLSYCLREKADEDAFCWAVDITEGIHRLALVQLGNVQAMIDDFRKMGG